MLEFFPVPFLLGLLPLADFLIIFKRQRRSSAYMVSFTVFWMYLLAVAAVTLFPMPISGNVGQGALLNSPAYIFSNMNLAPLDYSHLKDLSPDYVLFREVAANIILTLPFGFFISFFVRVRLKNILWLAFLVGFGIEMAQMVMCLIVGTNYRNVDINDAIMNALGVLLGYAFLQFMKNKRA
jgi:glycopeptide antibiotics resistance protein